MLCEVCIILFCNVLHMFIVFVRCTGVRLVGRVRLPKRTISHHGQQQLLWPGNYLLFVNITVSITLHCCVLVRDWDISVHIRCPFERD